MWTMRKYILELRRRTSLPSHHHGVFRGSSNPMKHNTYLVAAFALMLLGLTACQSYNTTCQQHSKEGDIHLGGNEHLCSSIPGTVDNAKAGSFLQDYCRRNGYDDYLGHATCTKDPRSPDTVAG